MISNDSAPGNPATVGSLPPWHHDNSTDIASEDTSCVRYANRAEGLCVQCMHLGLYDDEVRTIRKIEQFIIDNGYENTTGDKLRDGTVRRHHEIHLGNPRKTAPEKMKTVIRHPVRNFPTAASFHDQDRSKQGKCIVSDQPASLHTAFPCHN